MPRLEQLLFGIRRPLICTCALAFAVAMAPTILLGGSGPGDAARADTRNGHGREDLDTRSGRIEPTAAQRTMAEDLGASVQWNRFGAPYTLIRYGGFLDTGVSGEDAPSAARSWVEDNAALFRLRSSAQLRLDTHSALRGSDGHVLHFRQVYGDLPAAEGGVLTVGLAGSAERGWDIGYVSSTVTGDTALAAKHRVSASEAWLAAARHAGLDVSDGAIGGTERDREWTVLDVDGVAGPQRARRVAVPTYVNGVRPAWETLVVDSRDGRTRAYAYFIDGATGEVIVRRNLVHQSHPAAGPDDRAVTDPPAWSVFPANPPLGGQAHPWDYPDTDTRETWCWEAGEREDCDRELQNPASPLPWDVNPRTNTPTFTTSGNNAHSAEAWTSPFTAGPTAFRPVSPQRAYAFGWENAWHRSDCFTPFVPGQSHDISAATSNLFAMHNRMHDWSYHLGFTERNWNAQAVNFDAEGTADGDPLIGDAQAGALTGGSPSYLGRDNANMITMPDGVPSMTNMYLWQPLAGAFYAPCVDGDFDMAVIGHEYGHMIENRMIGKGSGRSGHHAGAMGESFADFDAMEHLNEYGFVPVDGENPFAVGVYVTGNKQRAIRNYGMNFPRTGAFPTPGDTPRVNPLNISDLGYDLVGQQVHANGEIWSAVNFDIRQALVEKYDDAFAADDRQLQEECAGGERPADQCPGNRRWIQLVYDAMLLMPTNPSMLQARDAYLAADELRFDGENQRELWLAFAKRGFGERAFSTNSSAENAGSDTDPTPDFSSPEHRNATVRFRVVDAENRSQRVNARFYVGHYEARVSPVADTDPDTSSPRSGDEVADNLDDIAQFAPGEYEFVASAPGYGHVRFRLDLRAGTRRNVTVVMPPNVASQHNGAVATGDGTEHETLIDDTEATNWDRTGASPDVRGSAVTVDLAGERTFDRVQVSAMLAEQNRFTALRAFEILACNATERDCGSEAEFTKVYTSPPDAFPGRNPRPVAPELLLRSFDVPRTTATHVRIRVLTNQCTGNSDFQGTQDADPSNGTDCREGSPGVGPVPVFGDLPQVLSPRDNEVHIAELQVFRGDASVRGERPRR